MGKQEFGLRTSGRLHSARRGDWAYWSARGSTFAPGLLRRKRVAHRFDYGLQHLGNSVARTDLRFANSSDPWPEWIQPTPSGDRDYRERACGQYRGCLLYTSDAADDLLCV